MSKSQAWSQPSHPGPAADLNLNLDLKFWDAVTEGFRLGSSQSETFNQNSIQPVPEDSGSFVPSPLSELSHRLPAAAPGLVPHTWKPLAPAHSLELSKGGLSSRTALHWAGGSLGTWGFYPALAAHRGFQRTTGQFQLLPLQPHIQELLLLLFPRKQGLTLVSFM